MSTIKVSRSFSVVGGLCQSINAGVAVHLKDEQVKENICQNMC